MRLTNSHRISISGPGRLAMPAVASSAIPRRSFLVGAASATMAASPPRAAESSGRAREFRLVATTARWPLVGAPHPHTDVWCYAGRVPGPQIRVRQGEPVRITVENKLQQDTPLHCHGIRLPFALDGVPGLTQPPVRSGGTVTFECTPPDPGTFQYHPP